MQVSVTFKNMKSSKHFKTYVKEKLNRFDKLLLRPGIADVVLHSEKLREIAEIKLSSGRFEVYAREEKDEMHAAIDLVLDKVKKQIIKTKEKSQNRRIRNKSQPMDEFITEDYNGIDENGISNDQQVVY